MEMFNQTITLIFTCFMLKISAQDPIILKNSSINTTEEAENVLAPLHISEALPVVLFEIPLDETTSTSTSELQILPDTDKTASTSTSTYGLHIPQDIIEAVTVERKMVNGTKFSTKFSQKQIFFCPKDKSKERCLVPRKYRYLEPLKCSQEPIPEVKEFEHMKCSVEPETSAYFMIYDICDSKPPYRYKKSVIGLYGFCYNKKERKVLFTSHFIRSPKLLKSKLLHREHNFSYSLPATELRVMNYWAIKNSLDSESNPFVAAKKPLYRVQYLVPSDNMSFGSWKKTVYQFVNADLQHRQIFRFWNEINEKVTANAILMDQNDINYYVLTGVFNVGTYEARSEPQIYNMWVKMIVSMKHQENLQGVVILMNNFLDSPSDKGHLPRSFQTSIEEYCPNDLCEDDFKNRVINIGGRMRCCQMTKKIGDLFGIITNPDLPVLQIPGLVKIQA